MNNTRRTLPHTWTLTLLLSLVAATGFAQKAYPEANMDQTVRPGNNFVQYAAGGWLKENPLKEDEFENGATKGCQDSITARMNRILTELLILPQKPGSVGEHASILYKQFADTAHRNALGIQPIEQDLKAIRQAKDVNELQAVMAQLARRGSNTNLFEWDIRADLLQSDSNIIATDDYKLPVPANTYLSHKRKYKAIRKAYLEYGCKMFETIGYSPSTAQARMELTYQLEKKLAGVRRITLGDLFKSQDVAHSVHKMSLNELKAKYKEIDWDHLFETSEGKMDVRQVDVSSPAALKIACEILKDAELEELKCLAEFNLLHAHAPMLTQQTRRHYRNLLVSILGQRAESAQWKMNTAFLSQQMKIPMGQLYCERYFSKEDKARVEVMVRNITKAFRQRLINNPWMTEKTRQKALQKLDNIVSLVAYPEEWDSMEGLHLSMNNTLCENIARLQEYKWNQKIRQRLNRPVDRNHWDDAPQEVNAYHMVNMNRITILAGILQPPFFDPSADEAINYGAIGTVIAHELTHGFDPIGCQFDSIGNVRNWWTSKDKHIYTHRTKAMRKHFGRLKCGGEKVNGYNTLRENVADNGGLNIALEAMHRAGINDTINGQTADQRFFLGYARLWARNCRPQYLWYLINHDPHAPAEIRVNGALPHIDAWYKAFGIGPGDSLYLAPKQRVHIW